jgi:hypothetical protein
MMQCMQINLVGYSNFRRGRGARTGTYFSIFWAYVGRSACKDRVIRAQTYRPGTTEIYRAKMD